MFTLETPHGPAWEFLLLFGVVLLGPMIVQRARVPGLIGLILGGFLIGPNGLGIISASNTTVPEIGQLGLLYLMFVAGVELDLGLLRVHQRKAIIFSLLTFSLPMAGGVVVGTALGWSLPATLLLGSLIASHTLLTYPMIRSAGLSSDTAVATAVGATVVADTMALVILAGVAGTVGGDGSTAEILAHIGLGLVALMFLTLWALPRAARWVMCRLGTDRAVRYLFAVCAFLGAAALAEVLGIEGIVGAFFAGLALNRLIPNEGPLMDRVEFFGTAVFVPVFLVSVGLILDPAVMVKPETLGMAAIVTLACLGGKYAAARLTGPLLGFNRAETQLVFSLTSPQAAATLAATMVGFQIGLLGTTFVNAVLVVILISVVLSTLVAGRAIPRMERPERVKPPLGAHVLVALEGPEGARGALAAAARISLPDAGAATVVTVYASHGLAPTAAEQESLESQAAEAGLDANVIRVHDSSFARGVLNAAIASDATLVLAVSSGDSSARAAGGWAEAVADSAPIPVAMVRGESSRLSRVVVAPDSPAPSAAESLVAELAGRITDRDSPREEIGVTAALPQAALDGHARPGDVILMPVHSWDLLAGLPEVPEGTVLIAVPEAAVG